jgi:hypothetical protein
MRGFHRCGVNQTGEIMGGLRGLGIDSRPPSFANPVPNPFIEL